MCMESTFHTDVFFLFMFLTAIAVQSGEVLIRQDGQLDGRSKAVRRGEVHMKT